MTTSYLPYNPGQQQLLPAALQDWLPEGHLAYYVSDTIDALDLGAFHARYAKGGPRNQPYHPAMMVKVLVYGYATGVFSSRKLAKKLHGCRCCRYAAIAAVIDDSGFAGLYHAAALRNRPVFVRFACMNVATGGYVEVVLGDLLPCHDAAERTVL